MSLALRPTALVIAGFLALAGCGDASSTTRPVQLPDEGIQMSGQIGGAQLSVSNGHPTLSLSDCDPEDGVDRDWCVTTRSIDGANVVLVIENPAVFVDGAVLDVGLERCTSCDDVSDTAVVDLVVATTRRRAIGGMVRVLEVGDRYALSFHLRFDDGGSISGECNVRPDGVIVPIEPSPSASAPPG